jgi:hypothetical protein
VKYSEAIEDALIRARGSEKRRAVNRAARRAAGYYTRRFKTDRRAPKAVRHPLSGLSVRRSGVTEQ